MVVMVMVTMTTMTVRIGTGLYGIHIRLSRSRTQGKCFIQGAQRRLVRMGPYSSHICNASNMGNGLWEWSSQLNIRRRRAQFFLLLQCGIKTRMSQKWRNFRQSSLCALHTPSDRAVCVHCTHVISLTPISTAAQKTTLHISAKTHFGSF